MSRDTGSPFDGNMIVKNVLHRYKIKQTELCERLGYSREAFSKIVNGHRALSVAKAKEISDAYNLDWRSFYEAPSDRFVPATACIDQIKVRPLKQTWLVKCPKEWHNNSEFYVICDPGREFTEYVYVIEDDEDFISLQHILVMFMSNEKQEIQGPFVIKHWRQDWKFENSRLIEYMGQDTWGARQFKKSEVEGTWTQAVFQVDDSPRYESFGRWEHEGGVSTWVSMKTWRPLPRREFSVRDDYDALVGTNRHTITPNGWVHEERNFKAKGNPI